MKEKRISEKLKVSKDTLISDLLKEYPFLAEILVKDYGLHCVGCFASNFDTIEGGARVHGMTDKEVEEMVKHLNLEIKKYSLQTIKA